MSEFFLLVEVKPMGVSLCAEVTPVFHGKAEDREIAKLVELVRETEENKRNPLVELVRRVTRDTESVLTRKAGEFSEAEQIEWELRLERLPERFASIRDFAIAAAKKLGIEGMPPTVTTMPVSVETGTPAESVTPTVKTEQGEGIGGCDSTSHEPLLTDKHIDTLEALRLLGATSRDKRRTASEIAKKFAGDADPGLVKEALAELTRLGYVQSLRGRSGGSWITPQGGNALQLRSGNGSRYQ